MRCTGEWFKRRKKKRGGERKKLAQWDIFCCHAALRSTCKRRGDGGRESIRRSDWRGVEGRAVGEGTLECGRKRLDEEACKGSDGKGQPQVAPRPPRCGRRLH